MSLLDDDISKVLISKKDIAKRTLELGDEISRDYKDKDLVIIGILKGAFVFTSDLARSIPLRCSVDFLATSSYGSKGVKSSGEVKLLKGLSSSIDGKDVLITEDILDSGTTLNFVLNLLKKEKPASVNVCTLLNKPSRRKIDVPAKYVGFTIKDEFVVGYGLGYNGWYRNLPYVGVLRESIWQGGQ